ncbi:hypothetical protein EDM56_01155 [Brevibacillus fluminis]|uniref:Uncharacterized protein n=1 Tax=Brevibacillus fluminis TaxID=511487 RepID=A0A3M8DW55_9BACL|nr:hypothetical protein EDM56_01155 [Brevibacillus fluminis]
MFREKFGQCCNSCFLGCQIILSIPVAVPPKVWYILIKFFEIAAEANFATHRCGGDHDAAQPI